MGRPPPPFFLGGGGRGGGGGTNVGYFKFASLMIHGSPSPFGYYIDAIKTTMASQITSLTVVYSIVYSGANQRKHQSSASLAFVRGIPTPGPVNSPHKGPVTRNMITFDDVIMQQRYLYRKHFVCI